MGAPFTFFMGEARHPLAFGDASHAGAALAGVLLLLRHPGCGHAWSAAAPFQAVVKITMGLVKVTACFGVFLVTRLEAFAHRNPGQDVGSHLGRLSAFCLLCSQAISGKAAIHPVGVYTA